ncbi:ASCH domain-containing protein [Tautonia plasticadhaerens]|uniref:ASCH domain protein n=1 Tax=Tautonia plasticadhaerens TaxID=2527974 RepID=A0A518H2D0_9BACT|nr:ASCH domain-containing protein [Tautonia plasticadhaerens]QDV34975.1 ASCH domain protein [Tautonia plasticadhaerens]
MKALSIQQPWAWLIAHGFKPLENRTWNTKFRGELLIHAGKTFDSDGYDWVREEFPEIPMPAPGDFERGGIVGKADLTDVVKSSDSPWFSGPVGFCLERAQPVDFLPMPGKLGFFEVDYPQQAAA